MHPFTVDWKNMDYKIGLIGRIFLLAGSIFFLVYSILDDWGIFLTSVLLVWVIFQLTFTIRYSEGSIKKVRTFLDNIKQDKYSQNYPVKFDGTEIDDLHIEFNAILAKLKEYQAEKEANYQYFRSVFKHLPIGLISYRETGDIQLVNTAAKRILGMEELSTISQIKSINLELHLAIQQLRTGGSELITIAHPDGIMQLSVYVIELMMRGEKFKLVSLQNIQSELEEKEMEAWQNLVKILTHEIMNSIAPISSLAGTLKGELEDKIDQNIPLDTSELEDYLLGLTTIEKRGQGLISFVSEFRSLANIPNPKFIRIELSELFSQLEILFQNQLETHTVAIQREINPPNLILFGDLHLIEQVLINLLQNAIQAVEDTPIKKIILKAFIDESGKIILEVTDTGKGIEEEALSKIFIPFFTTKSKGSGIGLSLSKQIMRRHKGNIQVRSQIGEGSIFKLIFNG